MKMESDETIAKLLPDESRNIYWSRYERRRWFFSLIFGTCMIYATRASVPLSVPVISKEKSWTKTDSGIILSSFFWGYTVTQVASGYVSDRIGGQKIIWFAALGWSTSTFFLPEVINLFDNVDYSVPAVATFRAISGAFQGMHFPSMISLTSQRLHESERASFFSVLISGSALGILLCGSLGSYLLENYNWSLVFQMLGGVSVAWTAILYYHSLSINSSRVWKKSPANDLPWKKLWTKPSFWACVIAHACQNNCFFVLLSWMPMFFHDTFPEVKGWVVNMLPWLSMLPCTILGKVISEKLINSGYSVTSTRKIIQSFCFVSGIVSLLVLARVQTFQGALWCLTLIIGGSGFHSNAVAVNPSDLAPRHSGSVFGLMNTVGAIPGFVGVYFAGYILHMTHSWPVVFLYIAAIDTFGWAVYLAFGGGKPII
ncbi:solute carrier family 17 member 9 [Venturia canescens]|uniref:solute carrier family 17 member 9 n=1 Tax=Venturia canescens TaxID=32260 RepID=UPI001C9C48AC|nr:solute carrier family 17 member 9 [Venturia canescens]